MIKNKSAFNGLIIILIISFLTSCNIRSSPEAQNNRFQSEVPSQSERLGVEENVSPIPITTPPAANVTTKKAKRVTKVVASFKTKILDVHKNRVDNIKRASNEFNNYVLEPGKTFSFNAIVGKRNSSDGYKKAKILVDGEQDEAFGGGICQLSSTIYNAAKKLGLKITERHTHSNEIYYLPIGQDAAVNYGSKDLKFINTKSYPIKFKIKIKKRYLIVDIVRIK